MKERHEHNKYNIDIKTERNYWMTNIINNWIKIDNAQIAIKILLN